MFVLSAQNNLLIDLLYGKLFFVCMKVFQILNVNYHILHLKYLNQDLVHLIWLFVFILLVKKSFKINYNLDLLLDSDNKHEVEYKIEVANPTPEFAALIPKYCRASNKQRILPQPIPSKVDSGTATKPKSSTNKEISLSITKPSKDEKKQKSKDSQKISKKVEEIINSPNKTLKKEEVKHSDKKDKITNEINKKKITNAPPTVLPKKRIPTSTDCESDSAIRDLFEGV
ncbi:hypothetical protein Mgra_00003175 [Meloidogyne graminicola]|uniref:Uncharacterized protein n=1 Tax=Meloidogyne graminicola TaxID=189291 RepID=A0A8S9ZUQ1_9BILA|nr:hypothetical protein Mgra_00003175 [Meloidogyne graminicola]